MTLNPPKANLQTNPPPQSKANGLRTVVVAGHICLDLLLDLSHLPAGQFERLFKPGRLLETGPIQLATGGPVANTGLALHQLGIPTRLTGKLGADGFGMTVLQLLASYDPQLTSRMIVDPDANSSYSVILNPPGVDRIFLHHPGANDSFSAADIQPEQLAGASLFHFGYPTIMRHMYADGGRELRQILETAHQAGLITSLDLAFPDPASPGGQADWMAIFERALPQVDLFLPSLEELLFLLRRDTYERMVEEAGEAGLLPLVEPALLHELSSQLLEMGVKVVVLKLGERGLYLRTAPAERLKDLPGGWLDSAAWGKVELWAPCFRTQVVGTTGAGDTTIAGFLSGFVRGLQPEETVTMAVAVGACNTEAADALSGLRSWQETKERVAAGWERLPLEIQAPGWEWDAEGEMWKGTG